MDLENKTTAVIDDMERTPELRTEPGKMYRFIKRVFDIAASLAALVILSPVFLILAALIKLDSSGPVIHKRWCVGARGPYAMLKFRSMVADADDLTKYLTPEQIEEYKANIKLCDDPRITRIGRFLRKTSLDELPQLINVLKGEMSFVGPRPVTDEELARYGTEGDELLSVKPGITGYWQTHGRSDSTYESGERQRLELYYVRHQSLWLDICIFFKTFVVVVRRGGNILRRDVCGRKTYRLPARVRSLLKTELCFPLAFAMAIPSAEDTATGTKQTGPQPAPSPGYGFLKRTFDVTAAALMTLICLVPMVVIAAMIMVEDPGNPFYVHRRVGQQGKEISVLKFRTMRRGADALETMLTPEQEEEYKREFKLRDDPRLIGYKKLGDGERCFGAVLRRASLDELPQVFYNVLLKGDMSFVGPRPIMREELEKYYKPVEQKAVLSVKPGITGYWQTHGRSDSTYETGERQKQELYYVQHQSMALDMKILLRTISVVTHRKGTY